MSGGVGAWWLRVSQTFTHNKGQNYANLWEIVVPRREGKTALLTAIGREYGSLYDVYVCTISERNQLTLGFPAFDVENTPVSSNTLLLIDDFDHCAEGWETKQKKVLEAGGLVVRTKSSKSNQEKRCIKIIL